MYLSFHILASILLPSLCTSFSPSFIQSLILKMKFTTSIALAALSSVVSAYPRLHHDGKVALDNSSTGAASSTGAVPTSTATSTSTNSSHAAGTTGGPVGYASTNGG